MNSSAELLLQPVRLQIIQVLVAMPSATTAQLAERLPEIPLATLYRHVRVLLDAGVLTVVDERPARGTVERTYRLNLASASADPAELAGVTKAQHRAAFLGFISGVIASFDRYLDQERPPDFVADLAGYRQAPLVANDDEMQQIAEMIQSAVAPYVGQRPRPDQRVRILTTVLLPA